jgi:hypothetical protein
VAWQASMGVVRLLGAARRSDSILAERPGIAGCSYRLVFSF